MTATNKKPSRLQNGMRPLGIIRQHPEVGNRNADRLSIENYTKKNVNHSCSNRSSEGSIPKTSLQTIINRPSDLPEGPLDHSQCTDTINELKQQIDALKQEYSQLDSEHQKTCSNLTICRSQNDDLVKENLNLESTKKILQNDNTVLKENHESLKEEFAASRDQWMAERAQLEKSLNEIRKELENKIIDIRNKHSQEIRVFEEKIGVLKNHLADTLNLRSIERQYELDRISADLKKSQDNEEHLRNRLRTLVDKLDAGDPRKTQLCENCSQSIHPNKPKQRQIPNFKEVKNSEDLRLDKPSKVNGQSNGNVVKSAGNKH